MYLYGASGHGKVVAEIADEIGITLKGFIDKNKAIKVCMGVPVSDILTPENEKIFVSIGNNKIRKEISQTFPKDRFVKLVHPNALISKSVRLKPGTVIMGGATVNADTQIGEHCIINTNASVDHDCIIEDFVHIAPNVALAGNVSVGEGTHIGIGACVIQGIKIGKWCTIGAGTVIIRDVEDGATVVGNPGRVIKINPKK